MLRLADKNDVSDIERLLNSLHKSKNTNLTLDELQFRFNYCIAQNRLKCVVWEENGFIIGCGFVWFMPKLYSDGGVSSIIEDVIVFGPYRKSGIGKEIVTKLIELAKDAGSYKIILNCEKKNIKFYKKCGFYKSGIEMRLDVT